MIDLKMLMRSDDVSVVRPEGDDKQEKHQYHLDYTYTSLRLRYLFHMLLPRTQLCRCSAQYIFAVLIVLHFSLPQPSCVKVFPVDRCLAWPNSDKFDKSSLVLSEQWHLKPDCSPGHQFPALTVLDAPHTLADRSSSPPLFRSSCDGLHTAFWALRNGGSSASPSYIPLSQPACFVFHLVRQFSDPLLFTSLSVFLHMVAGNRWMRERNS